MSALLLFSRKCKHSINALELIQKHKSLQSILSLHDVNQRPIPPQLMKKITHVPTIITKDGNIMKGEEVLSWLQSMVPSEFEGVESGGGGLFMGNLDGDDDGVGSYFAMDSYGESLKPIMTKELKAKIDTEVSDAYNVRNGK